ncbi:hypothetical protein ILUMI_01635 [Ignelater luminosus]|uniref:Histone deacetylase 8 n=1 Tax=Ignelater luminosus TaxID=2038154 RepID=A0A8K0DI37_IGNLU|nr:hypothetical protein ILUMI_01635 [Ignelater luminosus]
MKDKIAYIFDERLQKECDRLPAVLKRASIVQDLITCYNLLSNENVSVISSTPASEDELKYFHSTAYVDFLKKINDVEDLDLFDEQQLEFGLGYDCPLLPRLYDLIRILVGGSLTAAKLLGAGTYNIAINWCGGWHHAQRNEAEGFCYINDVVIAIQKLTETFSRILYIDLDIHHGNGVQNAFELSKKVLTLSFHKVSPGFYPGTGLLDDVGCLGGKYYSLNVPLQEGCSNKTYLRYFTTIFPRIMEAFQPSALVIQCGADVINGDPIGKFNVTPEGLQICVQQILDFKLPTLFLGGGGYNFANTARYWTILTSIILQTKLNNDIPDDSKYFTKYEPTYELQIDEGNQKDCNTEKYIDEVIAVLLSYCDFIQNS